jgi:hypothetical protein
MYLGDSHKPPSPACIGDNKKRMVALASSSESCLCSSFNRIRSWISSEIAGSSFRNLRKQVSMRPVWAHLHFICTILRSCSLNGWLLRGAFNMILFRHFLLLRAKISTGGSLELRLGWRTFSSSLRAVMSASVAAPSVIGANASHKPAIAPNFLHHSLYLPKQKTII